MTPQGPTQCGLAAVKVQLLAEFRVLSDEKVAERLAHAQGQPAATLMLLAVMQHVASLAERLEVPEPVVAGVMVEMRGREHDLGGSGGFVAHAGRRRR